MRIVLVGGGVIALLTAVECVRSGHEVVLVDQADIPFSGATSFDRHRVLRALHPGDPATTAAAVRAHHLWTGLREELAIPFYETTGALTVLPPAEAPAALDLLAGAGARAAALSPEEVAARYPHLAFPGGAGAVVEPQAGVLLADRLLAACAGLLRWHGQAELHPHRAAVEVDVDGAAVRLADGEVLRADAVLVAAGPWSRNLLAPEQAGELVLRRQSMLYCRGPDPDAAAWASTPAMLSLGPDGGAWLVPPVAGTPLKLSATSACRTVAEVGDNTTPEHWRDHLVRTFTPIVPGFREDWLVDTRDCHYLTHPTRGPLLALLGERVLAYAACGGSSFKFAPIIARSLADRLTGAAPAPTGLAALDDPLRPHRPADTRPPF